MVEGRQDELLDRAASLQDKVDVAIEDSEALFGSAILANEEEIAAAVQKANSHLAEGRQVLAALLAETLQCPPHDIEDISDGANLINVGQCRRCGVIQKNRARRAIPIRGRA